MSGLRLVGQGGGHRVILVPVKSSGNADGKPLAVSNQQSAFSSLRSEKRTASQNAAGQMPPEKGLNVECLMLSAKC